MSPLRQAIIAVDIGGTKTRVGAVAIGPHGASTHILSTVQVATPRVPPASFYDTVAQLIGRVRDTVKQGEWTVLPLAAVAHPGRFLAGGRLARGTTPNLGLIPGAFDGICPAEELQSRLGMAVIAENDAVAQMRFGLSILLGDRASRSSLVGETVVYLGPGTGMGGGVARISSEGSVTMVTDGHLFDMQIPGYGDGTLTAEELFTGPAIARLVVEANARLSSPIEPATAEGLCAVLSRQAAPPEQVRVARQIVDVQGEILALLIEAIHAGHVTKVHLEQGTDGRIVRHTDDPDRAWSAADKAAVRGVRRFLFGGAVGASVALGSQVRARALQRLQPCGLDDVMILQLPVSSADAGVLGVAQAISAEQIRHTLLQAALA